MPEYGKHQLESDPTMDKPNKDVQRRYQREMNRYQKQIAKTKKILQKNKAA